MAVLRKVWVCALLLLVLLLSEVFQGCAPRGVEGNHSDGEEGMDEKAGLQEFTNEEGSGVFYRQANPPGEISEWVDNCARNLLVGVSRIFGDYLYILVSYGPRPTGGYGVKITGITTMPDRITVTVNFEEPLPGHNVSKGITYPFDLALIPAVDLPVEFVPGGAIDYLMTLQGIDILAPIAASSEWIKVFEPAPGASLTGALRLSGVASVFEGTVNYRLRDAEGEVIFKGYTMAGMGDWYYFEKEIDLNASVIAVPPGPAFLELFTVSPRDGKEQNGVIIPMLWP